MKRYIRSSDDTDERINRMRAIGNKKTTIDEKVKQMTDSQLMKYIKENGLERDYKDAYNMRQDLAVKKIKQLLVQNHMNIHASTGKRLTHYSTQCSKVNASTSKSRGTIAAEKIQNFIDGYGFNNFEVYPRTDDYVAIDIDGEDEDEVVELLNRLHAWGLDADKYDHYVEIDISEDDRF